MWSTLRALGWQGRASGCAVPTLWQQTGSPVCLRAVSAPLSPGCCRALATAMPVLPATGQPLVGGFWVVLSMSIFLQENWTFYLNCGILLSKESMEKITWAHRLKSNKFIQISDHFFLLLFFLFSWRKHFVLKGQSSSHLLMFPVHHVPLGCISERLFRVLLTGFKARRCCWAEFKAWALKPEAMGAVCVCMHS